MMEGNIFTLSTIWPFCYLLRIYSLFATRLEFSSGRLAFDWKAFLLLMFSVFHGVNTALFCRNELGGGVWQWDCVHPGLRGEGQEHQRLRHQRYILRHRVSVQGVRCDVARKTPARPQVRFYYRPTAWAVWREGFFTAHIRRMKEGTVFTGVCLLTFWRRNGYPHLADGGRGTSPSRSGPRMGGYPNRNSIACTCYAAGGMPRVFTQKDFLAGNVLSSYPYPTSPKSLWVPIHHSGCGWGYGRLAF